MSEADNTANLIFPHQHLLGIEGLKEPDINCILDLADKYAEQNKKTNKKSHILTGLTQINLFYENSTRTRMSFELAGKRLGGDVINMTSNGSSIKKGETLLDTASTLNAMRPDLLVVRHNCSGAVKLLSRKVNCAVLNAGDGTHEHPTQALLDALTIRRRKGRIAGLTVAICGDILHSRVARSNIHLLNIMGARVRVIGPSTLVPANVKELGVEVFYDMKEGLKGCDVVMMLRLQTERMQGGYFPTISEYFTLYGLDYEKLSAAKDDAMVMHPGPMNRGVEIDAAVADDLIRSAIQEQVEMGVAVRMACLDLLTREKRKSEGGVRKYGGSSNSDVRNDSTPQQQTEAGVRKYGRSSNSDVRSDSTPQQQTEAGVRKYGGSSNSDVRSDSTPQQQTEAGAKNE